MIGSQTTTDRTGGYPRSADSTHCLGEVTTCELCEETRRCLERFDMVVCETCDHHYLPSRGLLAMP